MQCRGCTVPQHQLRLRLPFLAHATFHTEIKQWLRHQVLSYKHWLIPLHLPSHAVEEGAHVSASKLLFNFQRWETKMKNLGPMTLPCACDQFLRLRPRINIVDGHVASSASVLHYLTYPFDYSPLSVTVPVPLCTWGTTPTSKTLKPRLIDGLRIKDSRHRLSENFVAQAQRGACNSVLENY